MEGLERLTAEGVSWLQILLEEHLSWSISRHEVQLSLLGLAAISFALVLSGAFRPTRVTLIHARETVSLLYASGKRTLLASVVKRDCPSLSKGVFSPTPWLWNGHLQTVWAAVISKFPDLRADYDRELFDLPDGGLMAVDWAPRDHKRLPDNTPILILLHGLAGGARETYILDLVPHAVKAGYRVAALNFRGCGGIEIQTPQLYSGSYTDDVRLIIRHIHERNPASTLIGAGFSLGANILMKYVGEEGERCLLSSAVSVANPFDLHLGLVGLHSTWLGKEVYSKVMTRSLIDIYKRHRNKFEKSPDHPTHSGPIESHKILKARYLPDFDELATRRIFGFRSVSEYYRMGSSAQYLPDVRIPCLLLSDLDDPIAQRSAIPVADVLGNPYLVLATTRCGGHIGWFEGWVVPTRWFPTPVMEFVNAIVDARDSLPDEVKAHFVQAPGSLATGQKAHVHYGPKQSVIFPKHHVRPHEADDGGIAVDVGTMTDTALTRTGQLKDSVLQTTDILPTKTTTRGLLAYLYGFVSTLCKGTSVEAKVLGRFVALVMAGYALLISVRKRAQQIA